MYDMRVKVSIYVVYFFYFFIFKMPVMRKRQYDSSRPRRYVKAKRTVPKARMYRSIKPQILTVARKFWLEHWTPVPLTTDRFWKYYTFNPSQIPNWTDYFNLFDQYKINALKFEFRPRWDNYAGNDKTAPPDTNASGTMLHVCNDPYSSVTVPSGVYSSATLNSFMEQGNVKTYPGNRVVSVYFKPTVNMDTAAGPNVRVRAPWLTNNTISQHLGFHIFAQDSNFLGIFNQSFDVFVTAYFSMRNVR